MARSIADIDIALGGSDFTRDELMLIARVADDLGVGNIYVTEGAGRDAFSVIQQMAVQTRRIGLGTGIVNVFSRSPAAIAQAAASTLELMGDRRFNLGVGTSGKLLMEKYHGIPFQRPVTRLREAVQIIGQAFRTGSVPDGGDPASPGGLPLGVHADPDKLKIHVAGLSPRTLEVTGQYADGWLPIWPSIQRGGAMLSTVNAAADAAGRAHPMVSGYIYGGVGDDEDLRDHVRSTLAWYLAANGTAFRQLFVRYGYEAETDRICALWAAGRRVEARRSVPDHLLEDTTLLGDPKEFLEKVDRFIAAGIHRPVLRLPGQLSAARCVEMLARLARSSG